MTKKNAAARGGRSPKAETAMRRAAAVRIRAPISAGELLDKITILEIKHRVLQGPARQNVERELKALKRLSASHLPPGPDLAALEAALGEVNATLWRIEDDIRDCERRRSFGAEFIALARSVYVQNDRRAALKRKINALVGSDIVEEKQYKATAGE